MDETDRRLLLHSLRESQEVFQRALGGVTEAEAVWKPGADRWSILECTEHVAVAESGMFRGVRQGTPITEPGIADADREKRLRAAAADRTRKRSAPEPVRPSGRFASLAEAIAEFAERRERTIRWVESCPDDLRTVSMVHPVAGRITCHDCLWVIIAHPVRHAEQIREIREAWRSAEVK
jgi:hypothetical protein